MPSHLLNYIYYIKDLQLSAVAALKLVRWGCRIDEQQPQQQQQQEQQRV